MKGGPNPAHRPDASLVRTALYTRFITGSLSAATLPGVIEWISTNPVAVGAAIALALLWCAESVIPFFAGRRARAVHGARNLTLGLTSGLLRASFFPAALAIVTTGSDALGLGILRLLSIPAWAQALIAVLLLDLINYAWHVASHRWRFLWRFHAVHHHDDAVDSTTAFRFHAGDVLFSSLVTLCAAVPLGLRVEHVLIYEAVLVPLSIFHHGNIRLPARAERILRWFIVTPNLHWVHHSRWVAETDSNYAGILSVWDYLFGTLRLRDDPGTIRLGLDGYSEGDHSTLRGCLVTPFGPIKSRPGSDPREARLVAGQAPVHTQTAVVR